MRRIAVACTATVAVLILLIAAASGGASKERTKLQLTLKAKTFVEVDTGPAGDSPGDLLTGTDTILQKGRAIGRAYSYCVSIEGTQAAGRLDCTGTLVLPRGRIVTQQEVVYEGVTFTAVGAITGGTGIYRKARGEIATRARNLQEAKVILKLAQ